MTQLDNGLQALERQFDLPPESITFHHLPRRGHALRHGREYQNITGELSGLGRNLSFAILLFTLQPAVRTLNGILAFPKPAQAAGYLYLSGLHPGRPFRCFSGPPDQKKAEAAWLNALNQKLPPQMEVSLHLQLSQLYRKTDRPETAEKHLREFKKLQEQLLAQEKQEKK